MTKKFQQWAYALAAGMIALTMCFSISACSSDNDDNNGGDGISPVLFSDFNGTIGVNYPLGFTGQFVGFSIPKSMAGKEVDLTKPGEWTAGGSVVKGLYNYDEHFFKKGSYVYLRQTGEHEIELRFKFIWKDGTKEGSYKGRMTTQKDALDWAHKQGLY